MSRFFDLPLYPACGFIVCLLLSIGDPRTGIRAAMPVDTANALAARFAPAMNCVTVVEKNPLVRMRPSRRLKVYTRAPMACRVLPDEGMHLK